MFEEPTKVDVKRIKLVKRDSENVYLRHSKEKRERVFAREKLKKYDIVYSHPPVRVTHQPSLGILLSYNQNTQICTVICVHERKLIYVPKRYIKLRGEGVMLRSPLKFGQIDWNEMNKNTKDGDLVGMARTKSRRNQWDIFLDDTNETIEVVRRDTHNHATDCVGGYIELSKRGFVYFDQVYGLWFDTIPPELNEKKYNELHLDCEIFCCLVDLKKDAEAKAFFEDSCKKDTLMFKYLGLHKRHRMEYERRVDEE
eukprot:UN33889